MQEELTVAGFKLNPRVGCFQAVLNILLEDGVWHFGYLPERYMHRVSPTVERTFKEMSSSAVNKLEEALLMCGGKRRTLQVPHDLWFCLTTFDSNKVFKTWNNILLGWFDHVNISLYSIYRRIPEPGTYNLDASRQNPSRPPKITKLWEQHSYM